MFKYKSILIHSDTTFEQMIKTYIFFYIILYSFINDEQKKNKKINIGTVFFIYCLPIMHSNELAMFNVLFCHEVDGEGKNRRDDYTLFFVYMEMSFGC